MSRLLIFLFFSFFLFGCQSSEIDSKLLTLQPEETERETKQPKREQVHEDEDDIVLPLKADIKKMSFFKKIPNNPYPKTLKMSINNREIDSKLFKIKYTPYGIYVPETLTEYVYEDGNEFGFSSAEQLSVFEIVLHNSNNSMESQIMSDYISHPDFKVFKDEDLSVYDAYLSSRINEQQVRNDYFFYKVNESYGALIRFRYFDRNKSEILPTYLETAKHLIYLGE